MLRKLAKRGYVNTYEAPRAPKKEMPVSSASPVSSKGSVVRGNLFDEEEEEDTVSANLYDAFEEEIISTPKKVARRLEL